MNESTMFTVLVQSVLTEEEVNLLLSLVKYYEKGRKFTVYDLLLYWTQAAFEQWNGYRDGADRASSCGLPEVNYSTFSKKAKEVPFEVFKRLFDLLLKKCNRQIRRQLKLPKDLLLIDSTVVTVGKTRLPWAPFHGERAGIKLHVALEEATGMPAQVVETIGKRHDGPVGEDLADDRYIIVADRAYGKIERFDRYQQEGQSFVIRLKENVHLEQPRPLRRLKSQDSPILQDLTCQLGTPQYRSEKRHRVVVFRDANGNEIRVVTDLMEVSAERIAETYKARWQIGVSS
jgi:DDE family transposase